MAFTGLDDGGFVATTGAMDELHLGNGDSGLPMFVVEQVQLQFSVAADFIAAQVANNVLVIALSNGRILRIDLNRPEDIDDIDLPRKASEIGSIRRMFLDPTASHLLVCTSSGENYYLHSQSHQPRPLGRLKGVLIESVAWNPALPTASTREILLGASDGNIYETFIETSHEIYKRDVKHFKNLLKLPDEPITGLWADNLGGGPTSPWSTSSRTAAAAASALVVSPDLPEEEGFREDTRERAFAWLSSHGVYHGKLLTTPTDETLGTKVFADSKMLSRSQFTASEVSGKRKASAELVEAIALTQWHIVALLVLNDGQKAVGFSVDLQKNTFWLFASDEIFEIVVRDEDRSIWHVMLGMKQFDTAMQYARTQTQRETVASAYADHLAEKGLYNEAAAMYGRSNKPFEHVALSLIDSDQPDALRKYLLTKLALSKRTAVMQRMMIASWLVEVFMAKLNSLDDTIMTQAELAEDLNPAQSRELLKAVRNEYQEFVNRYKDDLDRKTVYDIAGSHGREAELLYFANAINDYNYVLSYWVQRERWAEALNVLKKQKDPTIFYRYSTVLMLHTATELVEILMRHADLRPRNLIPALLGYNRQFSGSLAQNQAVRYLQYVVIQLKSKDSAVHNTLVSIYASHKSKDDFDPDFALRLCIEHHRTLSCVHIYTSMGQYLQAVDLALSHNEVELAAIIADRPQSNPGLRKRLWLAVARKVVTQSDSIKSAIDFLKRCDLLRIEDLIPFFPDFVVIDDFKEEICAALEDYGRSIDGLRREMDESSQTAAHIKLDIAALDHRYAVVEPGSAATMLEQQGQAKGRRIRELQVKISKGLVSGEKRDTMIAELDALVASACILCSDHAIKRIDEPFIGKDDDLTEWAL
ncbi:unnamed protein product [Parascedosporium putredinis]|uniref:Pep3/Vps18/deep orange domain-containing protein n=1 Tax=Parascedosporium putredinis TaxID=1442378 RepID=A0A9P1HC08_9PEZI|nr:unnamed protein product [Parascedosporium putredinis]CAI8003881.1 unnamed protein product [Parascedosporium putredinis]